MWLLFALPLVASVLLGAQLPRTPAGYRPDAASQRFCFAMVTGWT